MDSQIPVLIVGAGPTGLCMAIELARFGVPFRIIDKSKQATLTSNATWIQQLTIELLAHMGLVKPFIANANQVTAVNLYVDGKSIYKLPLNQEDTVYPYTLMLPQRETEKLLNQSLLSLSHYVERGVECIAFHQDEDKAVVTLRHPDNREEKVICDWLLGCDGAGSSVRQLAGLDFEGEDLQDQFVVADAEIESLYLAKNEVHAFFGEGTFFAAFPLGGKLYRIMANLHLEHKRTLFTEREILELAQARAHGAYYVNKVSWISLFWVHGHVAKHVRKHSVFLAGDAAHLHSPAAGQGMNTGLQDAYNLSWKLALVIKNKAKPTLLASYESERLPVMQKIVHDSNHLTQQVLTNPDFLNELQHALGYLNEVKHAQALARQLMQVDIAYQQSPIMADTLNAKSPLLKVGMHAPNVKLQHLITLYDYLQHQNHTLVFFLKDTMTADEINVLTHCQTILTNRFPNLIKTLVIAKKKLATLTLPLILDQMDQAYKIYQVQSQALYLLRPDNYIAFAAEEFNPQALMTLLQTYLL